MNEETPEGLQPAMQKGPDFDNRRAPDSDNRRLEELRLLLDVTNGVVSHLDLRDLFKAISSCLRQVIRYDAAGLTIYDEASGMLRVHALQSRSTREGVVGEGGLIPVDGTPGAEAFRSRRTVLVTRAELENSPHPLVRRIANEGIRSGCVAPLISHGRLLGTIDLASLRDDAFSPEDARLLTQIAGQIAIAVENALSYERTQIAEAALARKLDHLRLMLKVTNEVVSQLDLRELIRVISACIREAIPNDFVGVALYDHEANVLRAYVADFSSGQSFAVEGTSIELEGSMPGEAFISGQPYFVEWPDLERFNSDHMRRVIDAGFRSGGSIPLIAHGRKLGVLGVASRRESAFSPDDKELLCQVANQVAIAVDNALAFREIEALKNKLASEKLYLEDEIRTQHNFEELIGTSATFRSILKQVETVAPTDSAVLIRGETGTGKELIARAVHSLSGRRERTLVKLNCAAIPTGLLESELFGHEKGAFTGAIAQRIGRFELAHKGTLFLDEVGDIPPELQPKLLRVLQEQEFERLGSTRTLRVDVRLIAATNCDLEAMVAERKYRSDLYYRLNVFPITIPPLRERPEDIAPLVRFFAQKYARQLKRRIEAIPARAMEALTNYTWPGNVRELEHFIERAVVLTQGTELEVSLAELKPVRMFPVTASATTTSGATTLEAAEREHILRALEETNWVIGGADGAAARLGMKRTTLQSRMQKLKIERPR